MCLYCYKIITFFLVKLPLSNVVSKYAFYHILNPVLYFLLNMLNQFVIVQSHICFCNTLTSPQDIKTLCSWHRDFILIYIYLVQT